MVTASLKQSRYVYIEISLCSQIALAHSGTVKKRAQPMSDQKGFVDV
jgi:hypothetical protein